ncbi:regulatory protein, luxR family [Paracoccus aminovorans]|uniref:Regulatory protein, luxR family n=1 Tax=Paracoccus aminovorans TaxID=34004 RepID=A0A1I3FMF4_9RHOB|nr:LuxR C-terminal-related transcriptional regulator [Paracoccus aminovorans]CQR87166.1 hypothetical protein JCM7685_2622 [Paracoccus aminovorans]SFI12346.1 regulatory protein, luxR family [Paracoccus aminovorans]
MNSKAVRMEEYQSNCPEGAMAYIADMLGAGLRDKMVATMGGTSIKIPTRIKALTDEHPLVRNLGRLDAEELVAIMPGESFYIPNGSANTGRRDAVLALITEGKNNQEVARILGISERMVRRHRSRAGLNGHELATRFGVGCQKLAAFISDTSPRQLAAQ